MKLDSKRLAKKYGIVFPTKLRDMYDPTPEPEPEPEPDPEPELPQEEPEPEPNILHPESEAPVRPKPEASVYPEVKYIRRNALVRGLACTLTEQEILHLSKGVCFYCGDVSKGIDRVDNAKGYIPDNCVSCCSVCNYMKHTLSLDRFLAQIDKIHEKHILF
jgi:hypothetical protein